MNQIARRSQRQSIELEALKQDPNSLLSWEIDDPILYKMETYRLYQAGFAVIDIAEAFDFSRSYLYELWDKFKTNGIVTLVDKRCGTVPRKRTTEMEAAVLRAKALNPNRSDSSLAKEFGLDRSTVYNLLKEHGLQDLHRVLSGSLDNDKLDFDTEILSTELEKKNVTEIVPCQQALLLSLLKPLKETGFMEAMASLQLPELERYSNEQIWLSFVFLSAWGVFRISHINDQLIEDWGILLDSQRRPDGDTLDQCLNRLIEMDEVETEASVLERQGQIRPGGLIDMAQQASLCGWVSAGLLEGEIWYFDCHVLEYTGKAKLGKTKHGTKQCSVKALKKYTLQNGLCSLNEYFPAHITFAEALRILVTKANNCLSDVHKIRSLGFDREGWDADLLNWLEDQHIVPLIWVKKTVPNVQSLLEIPDEEFFTFERPVGKGEPQQIIRVADTEISFESLGTQRTIVLEMDDEQRAGIYTTALKPNFDVEQPLSEGNFQPILKNTHQKMDNQQLLLEGSTDSVSEQQLLPIMTVTELFDAMRFRQRIENQFKVEMHDMGSDALPTHTTYQTHIVQSYDIVEKQKQLDNANKRLQKYAIQYQQQEQLHQTEQLDKHQYNLLNKRTKRLQQQTEQKIETITSEMDCVQSDENGDMVLFESVEVLDVRKLTLFNLFKLHALVALKMLADLVGLDGANPERLRRSFLTFGKYVEFNHIERVATIYVNRFPRLETRQAYQKLCELSQNESIILTRKGIEYQVRFSF